MLAASAGARGAEDRNLPKNVEACKRSLCEKSAILKDSVKGKSFSLLPHRKHQNDARTEADRAVDTYARAEEDSAVDTYARSEAHSAVDTYARAEANLTGEVCLSTYATLTGNVCPSPDTALMETVPDKAETDRACLLFDATGSIHDVSSRFKILADDMVARGVFMSRFNQIEGDDPLFRLFSSYTMDILCASTSNAEVCKSLGIPLPADHPDEVFDFYKAPEAGSLQ